MIVFDIETGPLDEATVLQFTKPLVEPPMPGPFDEAAVKLGNLKDRDKITAKVAAAKHAHDAMEIRYLADLKKGREEWRANAIDKAALSPLTGQVLAIGYLVGDAKKPILDVVGNENGFTESTLLGRFWGMVVVAGRDDTYPLVGHNICGFDLPFLIRRSWILGIDMPAGIIGRGRHFNDRLFIDTMRKWDCGNNRDFVSLDTLARALGVGGKPDGVDGGMFAGLLERDRQAALDYLRNDLEMTAKVAERMGEL